MEKCSAVQWDILLRVHAVDPRQCFLFVPALAQLYCPGPVFRCDVLRGVTVYAERVGPHQHETAVGVLVRGGHVAGLAVSGALEATEQRAGASPPAVRQVRVFCV
jgi:hypothetical protein